MALETFMIKITQPEEQAALLAKQIGWDGQGKAKEFILASPIVEEIKRLVSSMLIAPAKNLALKEFEAKSIELDQVSVAIVKTINVE